MLTIQFSTILVPTGGIARLLIPISVPTVVVSSRRMQLPQRPWTGRDYGETVSNLESRPIGWRSWRPASGGLLASCPRVLVRPSGKSRPSPIPRRQPSPRFCNISHRTPPASELEPGQMVRATQPLNLADNEATIVCGGQDFANHCRHASAVLQAIYQLRQPRFFHRDE